MLSVILIIVFSTCWWSLGWFMVSWNDECFEIPPRNVFIANLCYLNWPYYCGWYIVKDMKEEKQKRLTK